LTVHAADVAGVTKPAVDITPAPLQAQGALLRGARQF
jgi:hypothetical protein